MYLKRLISRRLHNVICVYLYFVPNLALYLNSHRKKYEQRETLFKPLLHVVLEQTYNINNNKNNFAWHVDLETLTGGESRVESRS